MNAGTEVLRGGGSLSLNFRKTLYCKAFQAKLKTRFCDCG